MTTVDAVRGAKSPQEAMLAIAAALDELLARDNAPSAPEISWGKWGTLDDRIEAMRPAPPAPGIPLEGEWRVPDAVDEGTRIQIEQGDKTAVVDLPPVSPERYALRLAWARRAQLNTNLGEGEDWEAHYAKGGPMWLYLGNRDYVLGLAPEMRGAMVADIAIDSEAEAHEVARDILKDMESGGLPNFNPDL